MPPNDPIESSKLLDRITQVEVFERFLQRTFPGKTRFSIEGLDLMIPVLDEIICDAAAAGVKHVLIAMAHRGRLNVLAHVMRKPYAQILAEFKDPLFSRSTHADLGWMGDVKYHAGARVAYPDRPDTCTITMPPNPSHLEAVDPLLVGMARAAGTSTNAPGAPRLRPRASARHPDPRRRRVPRPGHRGRDAEPVAPHRLGRRRHHSHHRQQPARVHRRARGVVLDQLRQRPGARLQDADRPRQRRRRRWRASKRRGWRGRTAQRFGLDFLIDLVGYRRHGHNEGDEPSFTQPEIYQRVAAHPTVRVRYAEALVAAGDIPAALPDELVARHAATMEEAYASLKPEEHYAPEVPVVPPGGAAARVNTGVAIDRLVALNDALAQVPPGFTVHKKLERGRERKKTMLADPAGRTIDWAAAEELALASVLADGIPVRFTGEDVERGTFSHRHAVLHDAVTGDRHTPLQALPQATAAFEIHNSALSELAVIGFELGYNLQEPARLVLWEAQYGDFINGAQTVLDEYLMSGRAKWGMAPSLVLLLPHGYEGQGPDHSSARVERFLQLAADLNVRIVNCTTAAQYFHVLRRQALLLGTDPLPLIVLTPKSLLRHPLVASTPLELAQGRFQTVIEDDQAVKSAAKVRRVVICSGKVYVDLAGSEQRKANTTVALTRLEQIYPFPGEQLKAAIERFPKVREVCWVQEEPENMGAWDFVRPELERIIDGRWPLRYVGRVRNSSPSEGSAAWHQVNQRAVVAQAFEEKADVGDANRVLSKQV